MSTRPYDAVRSELVQLWGRLGPLWGISSAAARVYAELLAAPEGADAEELVEALEMSRGAVSMACRELVDWSLVHAERRAGERAIVYRVEDDSSKVIRGIVQTRKRREWDPLLERVQSWNAALGRDRSREAAVLRSRLAEIEGIVAWVDDLADSFLRGGVVPRIGLKALVATARRRRRKPGKAER
jgi:DNA-binding transcriptional regulator GbsR (MarR family)